MTLNQNPLGRRAQKTQRTREKLINSTISLIKEGGFAAASSSRIAERAGITWGAAQHHFGTKEDILDAILDLAYDRFVETMAAPSLRSGTMEERVGRFIDRMWMHFQTDVYLASFEILLAGRAERTHHMHAWEKRRGATHVRVVREIFPDAVVGEAKIKEILDFVHLSLTGISIEGAYYFDAKSVGRHLRRLKMIMLLSLSQDL